MGQARDGAALGWTDASPKRNHRISSTQEERRGKERKKGLKVGGRRRRLTAKVRGKACVGWEGLRRAVRVEENSHVTNTMQNQK